MFTLAIQFITICIAVVGLVILIAVAFGLFWLLCQGIAVLIWPLVLFRRWLTRNHSLS